MKKLLLLVLLTAMAGATTLSAQTYKPTFGTKLVLAGGGTDITTNTTTLLAPATGGALSLTLPNSAGTNGYMLTTNGLGILSWTNPATGITLAGDVSGSAGTNTVDKIKNIALDMTGVANANILIYESTGPSWKARALSGDATITNAGAISVNSVQAAAGTTIVTAINDAGTSGTINTARLNSAVVLESESPLAAGDIDGTFAAGLTVSSVQAAAGTTIVTAINDAGTTGAIADNRVNDALTISGGTINSTPIGATTAATGRFTTITGTALPTLSTSTDLVVSNAAGDLQTRTVASLSILTTSLADGKIWVGNAGTAAEQTPGGNVTMTNTGNFSVNSVQLAAGTTVVSAINDAGTSGTINTARLNSAVVLESESPLAAGDVDGTFAAGLTVSSVQTSSGTSIVAALNDAATTTEINGDNINVNATLDNSTADLGLNLANPNAWTGTQAFGGVTMTPGAAALSTNPTNNYALGTANSVYYVTATGAVTLTGMTGGVNGRVVTLVNTGTDAVILSDEGATSAAVNQFHINAAGTGDDIIMGPGSSVTLVYTTSFWRVTSTN